jgi:hypothetical protein
MAVHALTPRGAAAVLVHLREQHGDGADIVQMVVSNPALLLTPLPDGRARCSNHLPVL